METQALTITVGEHAKILGISRGLAYSLAREEGAINGVPVRRLGKKRMVLSRKLAIEAIEQLESNQND